MAEEMAEEELFRQVKLLIEENRKFLAKLQADDSFPDDDEAETQEMAEEP
jgi:hypothetical protein